MEKLDYSNKRCLVVEDRRPFAMLIKGLLSSLGAKKIVTELSAEAALKTCKKYPFDIIVCDLHLGTNRKNGFEFLEEIRSTRLVPPSTVFIMISGDSSRSMVLGSLEKQPDDYLVKPFSQAQLNSRIARGSNRRVALNALYSQIEHKKYALAVDTCTHYMEIGSPYIKYLIQILVQLYWKLEDYDKAEALLQEQLNERETQWALCSMAKTQLLKGDYKQAISLAKQTIENSKNNVEAYDIIAAACLHNDMKPEALSYIQEALALSPLSIERHYRVCDIARANNEYGIAMQSSHAIWELSQRSVHKNINHMCTYIRSILDAAEQADNKKDKNKLKQEAMLALQRAQHDDSAAKHHDGFDFEIFEGIIHARVFHLEGKQTEAKRTLEEAQIKIEENFSEYPLALAPDSLKAMFDLGDYEEANKVAQTLKAQSGEIDSNIQHLMDSELKTASKKRSKYIKHNKTGIELYSSGNFKAAYDEFYLAKKISPTNIGVTLNLMQCLIKLMKNTKTPDANYVKECRELYRFINSMPLRAAHQRKYDSIKTDAEKFIRT